MTAIARAILRGFQPDSVKGEVFKQVVMFCAAGLLVSLLLLTYGLDLSPGLF
jgi:hypothetical protein